ncbi:MAG: hypothetical protein ABH821_00420 [archaeon]
MLVKKLSEKERKQVIDLFENKKFFEDKELVKAKNKVFVTNKETFKELDNLIFKESVQGIGMTLLHNYEKLKVGKFAKELVS